jgi:hypothetical protein
MGRTRRIVSPAQWLALVARDSGCVFTGCDRPAPWCQAHHRIHWSQGGPTDLSNLLLLCDRHHDAVHHQGWAAEFGEDGHPELTAPGVDRPDPSSPAEPSLAPAATPHGLTLRQVACLAMNSAMPGTV